MAERNQYYSFSASGSAIGGVLTSPAPLVIPTQAMASLSPSGGYGSATVENFGMAGVVSARKCTTTVQGDPKQTEVTVTLEGVDVMGVLTIERVVAHLVAQSAAGAAEASITPAGSVIEGLAVNGKAIPLVSSVGAFDKNPTYSALERAYVEGQLQGLILQPGTLGAPCTAAEMQGCRTRIGDVKATLYALSANSGELPVVNGGLRIKDFATLYLGEYRVTTFARSLVMLRVELGCDTGGSLAIGGGAANGYEEP
jgi:hypothetical protein